MKSIGPYIIKGLLGKGGMSKVYKVEIPLINKIAALKLFSPSPKLIDVLGLSFLRDQFIREAAIIANLRHPNILSVWHMEETEAYLYYIMAYHCQNLGTLIGESYWADTPTRILPLKRIVRYAAETLEGLNCLHFAGILHRDIKPFNLMLTDYDTIKIADFGLSQRRGEANPFPEDFFIGTKFYASPEQVETPDKTSKASDLYSVGVLIYRMLTGRLPATPLAPPSQLNPDLPPQWDLFFRQALHHNPAQRFSSARTMASELHTLFENFQRAKETFCNLSSQTSGKKPLGEKARGNRPHHLRSESITITHQRAKEVFQLTELWRPRVFQDALLIPHSPQTLFDPATQLIWQQSGSAYPLTHIQAREYIRRLNEACFEKGQNWRLPTVPEVLSILPPLSIGDRICYSSRLDRQQKWIWSCDLRSLKAAWYVHLEFGFVAPADLTSFFYARAVRSVEDALVGGDS